MSLWGSSRAKNDARNYRTGYPGIQHYPTTENMRFYNNEIECRPGGYKIDDIHKSWWNDYSRLERNHGYIQWVFPIREHGMNDDAYPLTLPEAEDIRKRNQARVVMSYKMMLNFYGMVLVSEETGEVKRSEEWRERFSNLIDRRHNNLRITRILKCLGELGLEHLKEPWLDFLFQEICTTQALKACESSALDYWLPMLKSRAGRNRIIEKYGLPAEEADEEELKWEQEQAAAAAAAAAAAGDAAGVCGVGETAATADSATAAAEVDEELPPAKTEDSCDSSIIGDQ